MLIANIQQGEDANIQMQGTFGEIMADAVFMLAAIYSRCVKETVTPEEFADDFKTALVYGLKEFEIGEERGCYDVQAHSCTGPVGKLS